MDIKLLPPDAFLGKFSHGYWRYTSKYKCSRCEHEWQQDTERIAQETVDCIFNCHKLGSVLDYLIRLWQAVFHGMQFHGVGVLHKHIHRVWVAPSHSFYAHCDKSVRPREKLHKELKKRLGHKFKTPREFEAEILERTGESANISPVNSIMEVVRPHVRLEKFNKSGK